MRARDRVEALVVVLAVAITLVALPVAAAVGTAFYDSRSRRHAELAQTSQLITGTVTSRNVAYQDSLGSSITVLARWSAAGAEHSGAVPAAPGVKPGDSVDIWVGEDGSPVRRPLHTAYDEAVAVGAGVWFGSAVVAAALVGCTRAARNRLRGTRWQVDFTDLRRAGAARASHI
jgi:hypothetical protein